ncbi:MAG: phospholipid carrier-dependent glycosyltransferase [Gammaproteobacteria bacterium]|nr:phospholipid carrier-dependent glycosyltransferase [Gammaproteobacteria bacterium]
MSAVPPGSRPGAWPVAGWFALLLVVMFAWVGSYPLMQPDEGRNAEVAREMVASGNYVVPHLNGLPYVDKPALHYAVAAASFNLFGVNEFAARLPSILFTLVTAAMIAWFGRRVWSRRVGLTAAAILLISPLTLGMSRVVILDAVLATLVVGSLLALHVATEARAAGSRWRRWAFASWACIGLGILTKGPVALLIPLLVGIPYAVRRRALLAVLYPPAIVLAVLIVAPWVAQMSKELPGYVHYVVFTETVARITSDKLHRTQPFWYFVPVLFAGAFPWICIAIAGLWKNWRNRPPAKMDSRILFLVLWVGLPFLFFSLSRSKLPHYMLPLIPAVALLAAVFLAEARDADPPGRTVASVLLCLLGTAAFVGVLFVHKGARIDPATLVALRPFAWAFGATALVAGGLGLFAKPRGDALVAILSLPMIVAGLASGPLLKAAGADRSAAGLASAIAASVPGSPRVIGVGAFPTSLPFYLGRPIDVSSRAGNELTSNYVRAEYATLVSAPGTTLHPADWWQSALARCDEPTVFVVEVRDVGEIRRLTEAGLPRLAADRKFEVYGPCSPSGAKGG